MCRWVCPQIGASISPADAVGISVFCAHGAATVLYTEWTRQDIRLQVAGVGNWLNRASLAVFFAYPFQDLGVRRITALVPKKNRKSRNLSEKIGFVQEGCLRHALMNGDSYIIYGMLREECRWLRETEDGQQATKTA